MRFMLRRITILNYLFCFVKNFFLLHFFSSCRSPPARCSPVPFSEGAMYHNRFLLSILFLPLLNLFSSPAVTDASAVPTNEGAIYQKPPALSRINFIGAVFFYFCAATRMNRFFPTRRTYSGPPCNSASTFLTGCSFTSTAPC